jgi:hypothetical protein
MGEADVDASGVPVGCILLSLWEHHIKSNLFFSLDLNNFAIVNHNFNGTIANALDGVEHLGCDLPMSIVTMFRFFFHGLLHVHARYRIMTCLPLFQYQKNEKFG